MQSRAMEHHDRCHEGTDKLYRYLATFFRVPADFADTIYLMQLAQAEAVKMGVESWRSRKFRTAGAIFWQFNDCWPVTSWSCLDWVRRPKALYYYARRFFAPVLPVIDRRDGRFTVTVVNDRPTDFEGELICGCGTLDGEQDWVDRHPVAVAANGTDVAQVKREDELDLREPDRRYFWCRLIETGREIARNSWPLLPYKHMQLEVPEWHTEVTEAGQREFSVQISTETFAKAAWLRVDGMEAKFSDNYMDVLPEVPVRFSVSTPMAIEARELHRRLRIRSAADAQQGRPELR
jgi:beta-mannosidase